jgi:hypothetical protein
LENQELSIKLLDYLRTKMSSVSNEELSQVYAALVLLKNFTDLKFERLLEYLTLRRVHSFTASELTLIFSSYGYLCQQGKAKGLRSGAVLGLGRFGAFHGKSGMGIGAGAMEMGLSKIQKAGKTLQVW